MSALSTIGNFAFKFYIGIKIKYIYTFSFVEMVFISLAHLTFTV